MPVLPATIPPSVVPFTLCAHMKRSQSWRRAHRAITGDALLLSFPYVDLPHAILRAAS